MSDPRLLAELSRRNGAGSTWWRRRNPAQRLLILAGLVVLAAVVSPTVRGALVGLVLLVALVAALTIVLLGRIVRRHPLADLAAGYLIGRRHARRHAGQYGPGYPPSSSYHYPPAGYPPPSWAPPTPPAGASWALPAAHVSESIGHRGASDTGDADGAARGREPPDTDTHGRC